MHNQPYGLGQRMGTADGEGGDQYLFSAHAEGGGSASVVNNLFIQGLERRWLKPAPPGLERDAVPRTAEMRAVREALAARESVARARPSAHSKSG